MNTNAIENKTVYHHVPSKKNPDKVKKLGRIHQVVFHPEKAKVVGFLVKRPDIAWMFHREDSFVAFNGLSVLEDDAGKPVIVVKDDPKAIGKGALKVQGVKLDECLLWLGLDVLTEDKTPLGNVGSVDFDPSSGLIESMTVSQGVTANALLGQRRIPSGCIKGFKIGEGSRLDLPETMEDDHVYGAIIVSNNAKEVPVEGGAAETAGAATAIAIDKAKKGTANAASKAKEVTAKAKEKTAPAISKAGEAVQKGAFVTGRQIARTEGMFKNFKDEFNKAMSDDD